MGLISTLFSFSGRINRRPLWGFSLCVSALSTGTVIYAYYLIANASLPSPLMPEDIARQLNGLNWLNLVNLVLLWPWLALSIKRAHDRGRSGWFLLLFLIPVINIWPFVEIWFLAGTPGANQYGPDPLPFAKPGLGWLILLGHLILVAAQGAYVARFVTFFIAHPPKMQEQKMQEQMSPNGTPINTPGLRPSNI